MVGQSFNHMAAYIATRVRTETLSENGPIVVTGTGFFYTTSLTLNDGAVRNKLLLISNKHVLCGGAGVMTIELNQEKDDKTPDYGKVKTFTYSGFADRYFAHPDESVDLACVDVSELTQTDAFVRYINDSFLTPIDYLKVGLGSDVLFIGYPDDRYDTVNNLPLVRKGTLASMPDIDFNGEGKIVIDAQVFPGSSGSPVFIDWDGTYKLLGVISETMIRGQQILGLGIVVKQRHVRELIDYTGDAVKWTWEQISRHQSSQ